MVIRKDEPATLAVRVGQGSSSRFNAFNDKSLHGSHCDVDHHVQYTYWKLHGHPLGHLKYKSNQSNSRGNHS